jgi:hypothetical protein
MPTPADVFEPDWIVTTGDGTDFMLVVEAKPRAVHLAETESQLKQYMLAMACPVGLLATPKAIRIYHDQYLSATEESVRLVGEYSAPPEWASWQVQTGRGRGGVAFDDVVREWLERLTIEPGLRSLPADLRRAVEEHLVPLLNQGVMRAAGPRRA